MRLLARFRPRHCTQLRLRLRLSIDKKCMTRSAKRTRTLCLILIMQHNHKQVHQPSQAGRISTCQTLQFFHNTSISLLIAYPLTYHLNSLVRSSAAAIHSRNLDSDRAFNPTLKGLGSVVRDVGTALHSIASMIAISFFSFGGTISKAVIRRMKAV